MLELKHNMRYRLYSFWRIVRPGAPLSPNYSIQDEIVQIRPPLVIGSSIGLQMNPHHKAIAVLVYEPDHEVGIMYPLPVVVGYGLLLA